MKSLNDILEQLRILKSQLRERYPIEYMGVFGSYVRNEADEKSDLDVLVDFNGPVSFFQYLDMEEELSAILDIRVDLVERKALKPFIGRRILKEVLEI
jgi:uncharacterized protein